MAVGTDITELNNGQLSLVLQGSGLLYGPEDVEATLTREEATHLCRELARALDLPYA